MYKAFFLSLLFTIILFVAHSLPINTNYIEKKIVQNPQSWIWWAIAFMYYMIIFLLVFVIIEP